MTNEISQLFNHMSNQQCYVLIVLHHKTTEYFLKITKYVDLKHALFS